MYCLPVSGAKVFLRELTGAEDVLLAEAPKSDTALALAIISRLAQPVTDSDLQWDELTPTDLDALLLTIRRTVLGETISGDFLCGVETCRARVDVAFNIRDYLDHQRPRKPRGVETTDEPGWFRLRDSLVSFRLPNGADQLAVSQQDEPVRDLIRRCVRPLELSGRLLKRVENAMEALAPSLAFDLHGTCPECGADFELHFDPQQFSLRELRDQAAFVYEDVHLIAQHYQWSEAEIMSLPRTRRIRYVEMIREEKGER